MCICNLITLIIRPDTGLLTASFSSLQLLSHVWLSGTPWTAAHQASLSVTNSPSLLKLMAIDWRCHSTISSFTEHFSFHLQSFPESGSFPVIQFFASGSFSFSVSPFSDYSGLISFRMAWLDVLAVQGTLKSLLQHHSSKSSILWHSAFFTVQSSHPYMTTEKKNIALADGHKVAILCKPHGQSHRGTSVQWVL